MEKTFVSHEVSRNLFDAAMSESGHERIERLVNVVPMNASVNSGVSPSVDNQIAFESAPSIRFGFGVEGSFDAIIGA